jgi:hypothetical protein
MVVKMYNIEKLEQTDISTQYKQQLSSEISKIDNGSVKSMNDQWHEYKTIITTAAERTLGEIDKRRRNDWFDEECQAAINEKNEAYKQMLQRSGTRDSTEEYRNKRREEETRGEVRREGHRKKKCTYENQRINDIEEFRNKNETRRFYKLLNSE